MSAIESLFRSNSRIRVMPLVMFDSNTVLVMVVFAAKVAWQLRGSLVMYGVAQQPLWMTMILVGLFSAVTMSLSPSPSTSNETIDVAPLAVVLMSLRENVKPVLLVRTSANRPVAYVWRLVPKEAARMSGRPLPSTSTVDKYVGKKKLFINAAKVFHVTRDAAVRLKYLS